MVAGLTRSGSASNATKPASSTSIESALGSSECRCLEEVDRVALAFGIGFVSTDQLEIGDADVQFLLHFPDCCGFRCFTSVHPSARQKEHGTIPVAVADEEQPTMIVVQHDLHTARAEAQPTQ